MELIGERGVDTLSLWPQAEDTPKRLDAYDNPEHDYIPYCLL